MAQITLTKNRQRVTAQSWWKGSLAGADVVYVEGIGFCSHQPYHIGISKDYEGHRMMDVNGKFHFVTDDMLFMATREEADTYWQQIKNNVPNKL